MNRFCKQPRLWLVAVLSFGGQCFAREADVLKTVRPFLEKNCFECHDAEMKKGGLDLTALKGEFANAETFSRWTLIHDRVEAGEMPPKKKARPDPKAQTAFLRSLNGQLHAASAAQQMRDGRVVLRRLNRVEYENTLHDLFGIDVPLKEILPEDTPAHGFDTVAEGLRLSALQMEKYLDAADVALDAAIRLEASPQSQKKRYSYKEEKGIRENLDTPDGLVKDPVSKEKHRILFKELPDAVVVFSDGYSPTDLKQFSAKADGEYRIRISAYGYQSKGRPVLMRVYSHRYRGKRLLGYFDMTADKPREVEIVVRLEQGELLQIVPYNTGYDDMGKTVWNISGPQFGGSGLAVQWIEIEGPLVESWPPPSVKRLFSDVALKEIPEKKRPWKNGKHMAFELAPEDPKQSARLGLESFAARAFRRPLQSGEADGFVKLAADALDAKLSFEDALRIGFRAVLTSPQFLLFTEKPGALDDYALASRLTYFLWSSMPDEELLALASQKKLSQPAVLKAQTERLLRSPRARAFVVNFTGQWLDLRRIDATSPDMRLYPEFDELLKLAMIAETEEFFAELLNKNLSVANFIHSDFVMLNRRIAEHYGIENVTGEEFRRVPLPAGSPRGGVLTQASVLKVTANGTVTSPVMRGTWVMKRLLGQPPRPPPPDIGSVEPDTRGSTTIREQLAKHRNVESCAACHSQIDPPGFALESFDVIGGWRERYRSLEKGVKPSYKLKGRDIHEYKLGLPVDASGELPDGQTFTNISDFKKLLLDQQDQVLRCLTGKLLTYGTGAGISFADRAEVERIAQRVKKEGNGLRTLVHEIVQSQLFKTK